MWSLARMHLIMDYYRANNGYHVNELLLLLLLLLFLSAKLIFYFLTVH